MTISQYAPNACVIETRFVWGKNISEAMRLATEMEHYGWQIQGNPAPMTYNGQYGTGVSISRRNDD